LSAAALARLVARCSVLTSFIKHGTGTALSDDNGRTLVTTAPLGRQYRFRVKLTM
jgi:hypothetical protein